jgi:hypothetical protein
MKLSEAAAKKETCSCPDVILGEKRRRKTFIHFIAVFEFEDHVG